MYKLLESKEIRDLKSRAYIYKHIKSGARIFVFIK